MGIRTTIELARKENLGALVEEATASKKGLKRLVSLLYNEDMQNRLTAAKALGEMARVQKDFVRRVWPRIFYAFDDTMSCWGVAEGLGEIARNSPELRLSIFQLLKKFRRDEQSCQGFAWAIARIGQVDKKRIEHFIPDLVSFLESVDTCILGQSIWALAELEVHEAADSIKEHLGDGRETWLYENDSAYVKSINRIAKEALIKLGRLDS